MSRWILAVLVVLLLGGSVSTMALAADGADASDSAASDEDKGAPLPDEAEAPQAPEGSNVDLMKKFGRHRAGACPEGPPCKVED